MMAHAKQHTIKNIVNAEGIGLHSGKVATISLCPAPIDTGIIFRCVGFDPVKEIKLQPDKIVEMPMCTKLIEGSHSIQTIEHLLSALAGMEIDNVFIDLDGDEIPVMDGSSAPFIFLIESAGVIEQNASRKILKIKKRVRVTDEDKFVEFLPCNHFRLEIDIDFPHPVIRNSSQSVKFDFSPTAYSKEVSRARTFGMAAQLEELHKNGLALGASLDNAVGLSDAAVMNPEGLRIADEFVRHKLLDAIGDLYVTGPIEGLYRGFKPSHTLNNRLLRALFSDQEAWEWT